MKTSENERQETVQQLSSKIEDYEKQTEQLQQNLADKDNERNSLNERANQVELELKNAIDDHTLTTTKYDALVVERDAEVQQTAHQAEER